MKVAHLVVITPRRCGLYETALETVMGLRGLGVDSRLVDPDPATNPIGWTGEDDRGAPVADIAWAQQADVIVSHSGFGDHFKDPRHKIVYACHGRPRVSYLTEKTGGLPLYSHHYRMNTDDRVRAIVTYWKQHVGYLEVLMPDKPVHYVPASVNLARWRPGARNYDFNGKGGAINVVVSDQWREDVDPYVCLNAFALWARQNPGAKLHLYGKPKELHGAGALIAAIQRDGHMGEIVPWCSDLAPVYRAADFVLTPHTIAVRTIREAMACGCPVVTVGEDLVIDRPEISREETRLAAARLFDPATTAARFKDILETIE